MKNLIHLTEAVEASKRDIAPDYDRYMRLAFALANSYGEAGREYFHRICRLCPKYQAKHADKMFGEAIRRGDGRCTMGTAWELAKQAGVTLPVHNPDDLSFMKEAFHTHTRARVKEVGEAENDFPPSYPPYTWPKFLQRCMDCSSSTAQRDILFLCCQGILSSTLGKLLFFNYGHKRYYTAMQQFIIAPPASGKGALMWARQLAMPIHSELLAAYTAAMKQYKRDKVKYDLMGKEKSNVDEPQQPRMKMHFIAGDNSGTGILENLMDSNGCACICESEADTVSTAIGTDYGHWSQMLRVAFDHENLAYNRRTNHEYRECNLTILALILSGTPAQLEPLIPSAENGLFSRQIFYFMPAINRWISQFDDEARDYNFIFRTWGERWKTVLYRLRAEVGGIRFCLTKEQQQMFDSRLSQVFSHACGSRSGELVGSVARTAINLLRLMATTALLRILDPLLTTDNEEELNNSLPDLVQRLIRHEALMPENGIQRENLADGIIPTCRLYITSADFDAVLQLMEPIYRHACHALSYLPEKEAKRRERPAQEVFLSNLPMAFTRQRAVEIAAKLEISPNTLDTIIRRLIKKGTIERTGQAQYRFTAQYGK